MTAAALLLGWLAVTAGGADHAEVDLERQFTTTVRPFVATYCISCHSQEKPKAQFDLSTFNSLAAVVQDHPRWALVLEKLVAKEMPPDEAKKQPMSKQRAEVIAWIQAMRRHEAEKHAGDPGVVLARRLNNAEYDYTIRDLTGVDLRPTREFPVDPANQAGFDNSGESLAMSPALLKLDHSCLLFVNNMWSGSRHDNSKLPVLTVGGLGGALQTGRVLDYRDSGDDNRKLCSLYLSLMDRMDVKLARFGDAESRLAHL